MSDSLFPNIDEKTISKNEDQCAHEGIYIVRSNDFECYIREYNPVVLRWNVNAKIPSLSTEYIVKNIGLSKGATYNHVLIVCTDAFRKFIKAGTIPDKDKTKCELYVAITRARYSVAFLYDDTTDNSIYQQYIPHILS